MSEALEIAERALALASGDEAEVYVGAEHSGFARYAGSEVHQPTLIDNASVQLRVVRGTAAGDRNHEPHRRRRAWPSSPAARRSVVASASDDPGARPTCAARRAPRRRAATTRRRPRSAPTARRGSRPSAIAAAGRPRALRLLHERRRASSAIASTAGLRASQRTTDATCLALAAADGASGYAIRTSWRAGEIDPAEVAAEAVAKAERTRGAGEVEPGRYRAVLEPYAISRAPLLLLVRHAERARRCSRSGATSPGGSASARSTRR